MLTALGLQSCCDESMRLQFNMELREHLVPTQTERGAVEEIYHQQGTATVDNDPSLPVPAAPALPLLICSTFTVKETFGYGLQPGRLLTRLQPCQAAMRFWSGVLELAAEPLSLTTVTLLCDVEKGLISQRSQRKAESRSHLASTM